MGTGAALQSSHATGVEELSKSSFSAREFHPEEIAPPLEVDSTSASTTSFSPRMDALRADPALQEDLKKLGSHHLTQAHTARLEALIRDALGVPKNLRVSLSTDSRSGLSLDQFKGSLVSPRYPEEYFRFEYSATTGLKIEELRNVPFGGVAGALDSIMKERASVRDRFSGTMSGQIGRDFEGLLETDQSGAFVLSPDRRTRATAAFKDTIGIPASFDVAFRTGSTGHIDTQSYVDGQIYRTMDSGKVDVCGFLLDTKTGEIRIDHKPVSRADVGTTLEGKLHARERRFAEGEVIAQEKSKGNEIILNGRVGGSIVIVSEDTSSSVGYLEGVSAYWGPPGELGRVRILDLEMFRDGGTFILEGILPNGEKIRISQPTLDKSTVNGALVESASR